MRRIYAALVLLALMIIARWLPLETLVLHGHQATLSLGFMLVFGYLAGHFAAVLSMPRITGYLVAGILCGPFVGRLLTPSVVADLQLIDDLALALIAFTAGGELKLGPLRKQMRTVMAINAAQVAILMLGMGTAVYLLIRAGFALDGAPALGAAIVFGILGAANSPATTVALIRELRARGPFTTIILGTTVVKDVVILVLVTLLLPFVRILSDPQAVFEARFIGDLAWSVGGSLLGGVALGFLIIFYMRGVGAVLPLFIVGISILVSQVARQFHLESLLLCMTAGFLVENLSPLGEKFIDAIGRSALPTYVIFFAIAGASLDLGAVQATALVTLLLVVLRSGLLVVATGAGARIGGAGIPSLARSGWMGFVAQAGVTLGIASIVATKFPVWGPEVKTLALAMIAVNQLLGPIAFRWAMLRSGEAGADAPTGKRTV